MILGIDLGSTSFKAAVVDSQLRVRGFAAREVEHQFADGGRAELAVTEATAALRQTIRAALASAGIGGGKLHAAAITSQAQTFTLLNNRGRAGMPFVSWQDTRAARVCERLKRGSELRDFGRHCSFGSLIPPLQVCQLRHLRETQPRLLSAAEAIVCLPTYFIRQWCGAAVIDDNLAAMTGLYSLKLGAWWPVALRVCGVEPGQLPRVLPIGGVAGRTLSSAGAFGLPKGLPVILAGNDQTAGAYAARLDENRGVLLTLGTAQTAYVCTDKLPRSAPHLIRGPFPERRFYRMAADSCGGSVINWAKTILAGGTTDEDFFALAVKASPGCAGLRFEPDLDAGKGAWNHLALHHAPADFARSVLESLSRRMAGLINDLGVRLSEQRVFVAGGGSENALWVRILSETLGVKLNVAEGRPCIGAARLALKALSERQS